MTDPLSVLEHVARLPLTWLLATLAAYRFALGIQRRAGFHPLAHPVAVATGVLVAILMAAGVDYPTYFEGAQLIHFLLGPATVALAVPLYQQFSLIRRSWLRLLCGALLGSAAAIATAVGLAALLGASEATILAMATKSVTMPIALALTERMGGLASLTSALVMLTGVLGAMIAQPMLVRLGIAGPVASGFSLGVVSHGIGTARALQSSPRTGAFAGLGMGLAGLLTAVLLPIVMVLAG
ncbi:MAG: LrgB family protein [Burkholderiaceae bacterium]